MTINSIPESRVTQEKLLRSFSASRASILFLVAAFLVLSNPGLSRAQQTPGSGPATIDAKTQLMIIDSVTSALDSNYVFPDKAKQMGKFVREQYKKGIYKSITDASRFADKLTEDLRSICQDKHLGIRFTEEIPNYMRDPDSMSQTEQDQYVRELRRSNFGFYKVERLEGNVGYLDLRQFVHARWAGATAVAAMNFLGASDALIIDVRQNGGGEASMIQLLASYFFDEPKHINSFYIRPRNTIDQYWTQAYVPGNKMPDIPLFILTSSYTFSAAEEFTYNLKNMKRATIVGENTGGGAHPVMDVFYPSIRLGVRVPMGRAINPITGTNWEGTGIAPDIAVPQQKALSVAHREAIKKIMERTTDDEGKKQLAWTVETMSALDEPVKVDIALLQRYAGKYGPRVITLENGELYYQREGRPKYKMTPMSQDTFVFDDLRYFRLRFATDSGGQVKEIVGIYDDGHTDASPRTAD